MNSKDFEELNLLNLYRLQSVPEDILKSADKVVVWMMRNNVHMIGGLVPYDVYRQVILEDAAKECEKRITNENGTSRLDNEAASCARDIRVLKNKVK